MRRTEDRVDAIVVARRDRASGSLLDLTALMAAAARQGWALVALDCAVDGTAPGGEPSASVLATFAQCERRLIGERTREALAAKRREGVKLGRPRTLPDSVRRRIISEREAGRSLAAIAEGLSWEGVPTAHGGKRWWPETVRGILAQD